MTKRRLTRRQSWRIDKIQRERLERAGRRDADLEKIVASGELGPEQMGRIVAHFGTQVSVEREDGSVLRCYMRANLGELVTGDRVVWREGDGLGVVVARESRHTELARPDVHGRIRTVAANIDQVLVVMASAPRTSPEQIDRYLVAAEVAGIEPMVVLNKIDLLAEASPERLREIEVLLAQYRSVGYASCRMSTTRAEGLDPLRAMLSGKTSVFVGESGVGKSSLINLLLPKAELRVGPLSATTGRGTHTTTSARLFHFPGGGDLIDSPGIREFGLWHMEREQIEMGFREFRPFLGRCRFRNCRHRSEPGCAIRDAQEQGAISELRFDSFQALVEALANS